MTEILLRNATVMIPMDDAETELSDADILMRDGEIIEVGQGLVSAGDILDCAGCVVTPGLVNTHHHLYQTLTRAVPGAQDAALFGWLQTLYPIWARFTPEHMRVSALTGLAELALSGCTMSSDHLYLYPNGSGLDDTIEAAATISGCGFIRRAVRCRSGKVRAGCRPTALWSARPISSRIAYV